MAYPFATASESGTSVTVTGLNGAALSAGTRVTGEAALRAIVMQNAVAKYTYERPTVDGTPAEPAAGHLFLKHEGAWLRCWAPYYGDWSFFAAPLTTTCDYADVVEASEDAAEIAFVWTSHALNVAYLGGNGVLWRDNNNVPMYADGGVFKWLTNIRLTKLVRLERGRPGVFTGWHSYPHVGPPPTRLYVGSPDNNEQAWVERELGTGRAAAVAWSSANQRAYFPAWALQRAATWAAAEASYGGQITERHWWSGIDDPTYGVMATAGFKLSQYPNFPNQQLVGPWYIASIPAADAGLGDVCTVTAQHRPIESGGWQFMPSPGRAAMVMHHCNNWMSPRGVVYRFQLFNGAVHYDADPTAVAVTGYTGAVEYGNEPTQALVNQIDALVNALTWPDD